MKLYLFSHILSPLLELYLLYVKGGGSGGRLCVTYGLARMHNDPIMAVGTHVELVSFGECCLDRVPPVC